MTDIPHNDLGSVPNLSLWGSCVLLIRQGDIPKSLIHNYQGILQQYRFRISPKIEHITDYSKLYVLYQLRDSGSGFKTQGQNIII